MIFIGCDPGLIHPAIAILEDGRVSAFALAPPPREEPLWSRADLAAMMALEKVSGRGSFYLSKIVLGIETAAFVPHSRSMEQMACCRQALYSVFREAIRPELLHVYEINPTEAKRAVSCGNARKAQIVEVVRVMYPQLFRGLKVYTSHGKVASDAAAIADAVAIMTAARLRWKRAFSRKEKLCIDSSR